MEVDLNLIIPIAGLIIAILSFIGTYIIYIKQKTIKKININFQKYTIFEQRPNMPNIRLIVEDIIEVDEAQLLEFNIQHIGNKSIDAEDFINPIEIDFNEDSNVLSTSVTTNQDLTPEIENEETYIKVKPIFLNPDESFLVNLLINNYKNHKIKGKIRDGVIVQGEKKKKYTNLFVLLSMITVILMVLITVPSIILRPSNITDILIPVTFLGFLAVFFFTAPAYWDAEYRKRIM